MLVRRALRQEDAAIALDQGADDGYGDSWIHGPLLNKGLADSATFPAMPGSLGMNTFLKILLVAVLLIVAIKLSPVVFVAAVVGLAVAALLGVLGLSLIAALLAVALALVAALAPIWIPVLAIMGVVSLYKKLNDRPQPPVITA